MWSSATWDLGTNSAVALGLRKTTENLDRVLEDWLLNCWWPSPTQRFLVPSPTGIITIFYSLKALRASVKIEVKIEVMLRPTVSRSVMSCVKPQSGVQDQIFITARHLRVCWCGTPSLSRGRVCRLQLLLAVASAVILRSESRGTHSHILVSQVRDSPNLEALVTVFLSPRTRMAQLYFWALGSLFSPVNCRWSSPAQPFLVSGPVGTHDHIFVLFRILCVLKWGLIFDKKGLTTASHSPYTGEWHCCPSLSLTRSTYSSPLLPFQISSNI
jgi:hypothetical protein